MSMMTRGETCPDHGEYQSFLYPLGEPRWTTCPECSKEEIERNEKERQERQPDDLDRNRKDARLSSAGIPKRLQSASLSNYRHDGDSQEKALRLVCDYVRALPNKMENGDGLIMMGNMGTGKTHLICGTIKQAIKGGCTARYYTASELFDDTRASFGGDGQGKVAKAKICDLLALDEIGVGRGTDTEMQVLHEVLGYRYDECLPTIIATNLDAEGLRGWIGDRIFDRLRENSDVILFDWESNRGIE